MGNEVVNNRVPYLDTRDIVARIDHLVNEIAELDLMDGDHDSDYLQEELESLQNLMSEVENVTTEWRYGVTLIRDDEFRDYAEDFATDVMGLREQGWPLNHIDWAAAANELKQDYSEVDYDGVSYWVR